MAHDAMSESHPLPWRCVSIDVEEYFHIEAAFDRVGRADWGRWPTRVERNIDLLLSIFNRHSQHGTFFILGDVACRHPLLARRITDAGHEVASHGSMHDRLHRLDAKSFRLDLVASKSRLEDQIGKRVLGYRAPTFSIVPQTAWSVDVLAEEGFEYDASIFPVRHPWYGVPSAPDRPFYVQGRPDGPSLLEVPPLTWVPPLGGTRKLAVAGGGYFRLLPLGLMKLGLAQAAAQKRPAVLYFHPWEFDPLMPRMPLTRLNRLRTYKGLGAAVGRLEHIMRQPARWSPIAQGLDELRAIAAKTPNYCLDPGH